MVLPYILFIIPFLMTPVFAQSNSQILPTEKGTLNVELSTWPDIPSAGDIVKLNISFINPTTGKIQEHIDYSIMVSRGEDIVLGPIPITHTSIGRVTIPIEVEQEGTYKVAIDVVGILFQPIPSESVSFDIGIGAVKESSDEKGGGCLIATAAFGSEMSNQVQQLREIRDNIVMNTESGTLFMAGFNQLYYSFSPAVADFERQNPIFKEVVRLTITPLISSLSVLNYLDIDSEEEMLGYGIGIILFNIGMYVGIPIFSFVRIKRFVQKRSL